MQFSTDLFWHRTDPYIPEDVKAAGGLALMRAQASMIFNYALATTRAQYITALPRGRRAANSRARGHAAGRAGASGGRMPAPRAGHGR